jgi:predicted AlkP superfamily phosphohydrolase/phosphomutase
MEPFLKKIVGTRLAITLRESILREIDLTETRAFAQETAELCGMIFVNREYARLRSIDEADFVRSVKAEIRDRLEDFGEESGLEIETYSSEELYVGELSELAPDLLFKMNDFAVGISYRFGCEVYEHRQHFPMKTGSHRLDGIFIGYGSRIGEGVELPSLNILDVAPTIYQLLGESVPMGLDGRVASEVLLPEHRGIFYVSEPESKSASMFLEGDDSTAEAEEIRRRLRDLGYLD